MDSNENQPGPASQPRQHNQLHPLTSKLKPFLFYTTPILTLFLAISFTFTKTHYYKNQHLKKSHQRNPMSKPPSYCVRWMAPFLSGGGYSSESWSYILSLKENMKNPRFRLAIDQHGDLESLEFWEGLPQDVKNLAFDLYNTECQISETIVVCHSEPGAWYPPLFQTLPCPPTGYGKFLSVIGRTMFETDSVNLEHVKRCNRMDYVWVPTDFHVSTFVKSGVDASKVVKIVQPIDVNFFDPLKYEPLDIASKGNLVLGAKKSNSDSERQFVFLSVFKWEYRKGWDVLFKAYLQEFSKVDGVALYLLTNPYHSDRDFGNKIVEFVDSEFKNPVDGWAPIYVIDTHIAQIDLPRLYKAADAFLLPSRGEGWGRPLVEAMAMSLPVIATNWSGPTEYLTEENSYPLPVDRMSEVMEGPFRGHFWAEPSVNELRLLMRRVMCNVEEAKSKGRKAREDMIRRFSPEIVANIVTNNLHHILDKIV
ncbi:Glycos_transf_1 domain-containing protein [Cephalotus follicularis]|uniref:Glycos_transf_1 domain-containing protein n=1 Tax=Cephalotus follicularis TaxID=3775 RepID=A0A1Q3B7Z9_CEPFO|nr:Glycos_transf_1 domain-containing protein [Cephalotus follicularis]